ncbi:MAG TPA: polyprenyl synthetase family protein, partial [Gemmatimonadaceae bacterium]|nr:polyprenyl synthetase family protein [Gemmatimonadaceae bacterium]
MSSLSTMSEPRAELARAQSAINEALARFADRHLIGTPDTVRDAIRYSLLGEGKRMRGILVMSAYEAAGGVGDASELAAAVEVVHAYSLVHDDLPCMDDDDVRRGQPTVHRVYGVRAATAAGLAMVPLAALCAADAARALALDDAAVGSIVADLMRASGAGGMIGGQLLDLEGEGRPLQLAELERIHRSKTGALITAAATLGGRAAQASAERLQALA